MSSRRALRIALRWVSIFVGLALGAAGLLVFYGAALVDQAMRSSLEAVGSKVVSAPLVLRSGEPWSAEGLRGALRIGGLPEAPAGRGPERGEFTADGGKFVLGAGTVNEAGERVAVVVEPTGLSLRDETGRALQQATLKPALIGVRAADDIVRWPVRIEVVAPHLLTAVVDVEDRTFLSHGGLSFRGMVRAAVRDFVAGGVRQGGSTITQQLAKILMLRPARTVPRKILEAWLAALLDYRYDKRAILEAYLNRVYLGQDGGLQLQGVEAASRYCFGKSATDLRLEESTLLAGMIAAPNRFDAFLHRDAARARRAAALAAMAHEGHLDQGVAQALAAAPIPDQPHHLRWGPAAQYVERVLADKPGGVEVRTALDAATQQAVHDGSAAGLRDLEKRYSLLKELARAGDPLQVAAACVTPDGRVLALQGSRDALPGEFNRAIGARRQIGSLVKPFVVASALESGWSLDSELADAPLMVTVGQDVWQPANSDGKYRGNVTVREALVQSLNVPMVRLGLAVSVGTVARTLQQVGFSLRTPAPAILLGSFEASPLEVARAYATLAARGNTPRLVFSAADPQGSKPSMPSWVADSTRAALEDVARRGTAAVLAKSYEGALAAKTGTTDERRDSWFVAIRPRCVVAVWAGTDGNRETGLFGATGALEIWRAIDARLPAVLKAGHF